MNYVMVIDFILNPDGKNIKSTGFTIVGQTDLLYITDIPNKNSDGSLDGSGKRDLQ